MSLFAYNKNMKRLVLILSFAVLALVSYGQEAVQPEPAQRCILRYGDRYVVAGVTYNNSTAFRNYLRNTNHEIFSQYNQGYKLGMAGWGLLAYGTVTGLTSVLWMRTQVVILTLPLQATIGGLAMIAGISLLGVGYHKMHHSVRSYNSAHRPSPQTYWSIQLSGNGIGVAYNF